jgi:uncharacterized protein with PIN domain
MVGIPLTEVGDIRLDGATVDAGDPLPGDEGTPRLSLGPRARPQPTPTAPPRFLLDVHLGSLARRLRLLGLDTAYETEAGDDELVRGAIGGRRVLLSRDRGLLSRSALPEGALVRGDRTEEQLEDVLDRFAPPLAPWSRCVRCNATLTPAATDDVAGDLEPGTRRTYREFSRCTGCGRVYWRGAHAGPLEAIVRRAEAVVAARRDRGPA